MKKITGLIGFIAGSLLSIGILTGCGDQFQEEYPWMIGCLLYTSDAADD